MVMDVRSAELTKYAANAMLATRISFMNELANLAETLGADIEDVRRGIGSDPRIGYHFLYPGAGYGGSCFPKDVKALQRTARRGRHGRCKRARRGRGRSTTRRSACSSTRSRARFGDDLARQDASRSGAWRSRPNTDDMREAPSLRADRRPRRRAARRVRAYDPGREARGASASSGEATTRDDRRLAMAALEGADALVIVTEWKEFRSPDFAAIKAQLKTPVIFDGRNLYDPAVLRAPGIEYFPIGRKA